MIRVGDHGNRTFLFGTQYECLIVVRNTSVAQSFYTHENLYITLNPLRREDEERNMGESP